jgi:hypothetical protein
MQPWGGCIFLGRIFIHVQIFQSLKILDEYEKVIYRNFVIGLFVYIYYRYEM